MRPQEGLRTVLGQSAAERHKTGSYCTPHGMVAFMCREALARYLAARTHAPLAGLAAFMQRHDASALTPAQGAEIAAALDKLKALDPACGSGAFLLGLLHEVLTLYRVLYRAQLAGPARSRDELRRRVARHNLHGVDSDPRAAQTARLRLWLAVDGGTAPPPSPADYGFHIETGNALLDSHVPGAPALLRRRYDIVLLNPPYVAAYSRHSEKAAVLAGNALHTQYRKYGGRTNLFTCFIIRAGELLRPGGCAAYIVPDSYATSDAYARVRAEQAQRFPAQAWVLVKPPVFGAQVRNVVVIAGPGEKCLRAVVAATEADLGRLEVLLRAARPASWGTRHRVAFFASPFEEQIWTRLRAHPGTLAEWFETRDGVNPGLRTVRERILDVAPGRSAHVRPVIEGTQIAARGYRVLTPERTILYDPAQLSRAERRAGASLRDASVFMSPKIVSRQTADTLIAALDLDGDLIALNSVHCTHARTGDIAHLWGLLALLNSPLLRLFHALDGGETREVLPQVHISRLRELPLPPRAGELLARLAPLARRVHGSAPQSPAYREGLREIHEAVCTAYGLADGESRGALAAYLARYPRSREEWDASG